MFTVYSFFVLLLCPFLPVASKASNETNTTVTEDPPPAKKTRRCQRQEVKTEPVAEGKADKDRTEDKQGQPSVVGQGGHGPGRRSRRGKGGGYLVLSTHSSRHNNFLSFRRTIFLEPSVS